MLYEIGLARGSGKIERKRREAVATVQSAVTSLRIQPRKIPGLAGEEWSSTEGKLLGKAAEVRN